MVTCPLCGREFVQITNTHLKKAHQMDLEEFNKRFPGFELWSEERKAKQSESLTGKNVGNARPDARKRMNESNPMKTEAGRSRMGKTRSERIANGSIAALKNLGHLPTANEKEMMAIFERNNIPLKYVGDGQLFLGNKCPDFVNEDMRIVVELDLDHMRHEAEKDALRKHYLSHGYLCVHLVTMDETAAVRWLAPFFNGGPRWEKIKTITKKELSGRKRVFNYHVGPNNNYFADRVLVHNCFADAFRASLYTSFFDNSKSVGLRHCNPDFYKTKLDEMFNKFLGKDPLEVKSDLGKALAKRIPIRFGIRFEDFLPAEKSKGISLELLNYLRKAQYPLMINTKSDLVGEDAYVRALSRNKAKTAVHITMISCDEDFLRVIEPGAPTFAKRIQAAKNLSEAGVRVVARIEPYMVFLNDSKDMVQEYFGRMKEAGVTHLTFDTYSYSANNPGIRQNFVRRGYDWERMFLLTSDSQAIGSLLLSKFMDMFREQGFSASSFDMGGAPDNDDTICCSVGDWFPDAGYNWGCTVGAVRYIKERGLKPTSWNNFHRYVMRNGGFLSKVLEEEVKELWNLEGNASYFVNWGRGIEPCGHDEHGILWHYRENPEADFRYSILEGVI